MPKYIKGDVRLVFASIFPSIETFRLKESRKLERLYGMWLPAISYRAPQVYIFEHFSIYYKLAETYQVKIVETANEAEKVLKEEGRVGFILHMEGTEAD
jgi:membrane dipeptidase